MSVENKDSYKEKKQVELDENTSSRQKNQTSERKPLDSEIKKEEEALKNPLSIANETIEKLTQALDETKDKLLRALAETENTKQRSLREVEQARLYANEKFAKDVLTIADNLDQALCMYNQKKPQTDSESLIEGVKLTRKALKALFERYGIQEDNPLGETFNPHHHQAISNIPDTAPKGQIITVMQKGYKIRERVLRASMVVVSSGADEKTSEKDFSEKNKKDQV